MINIINNDAATNIINRGGLVAFPTETVYGIGADATNQQACLDIYRLKNRPAINPLIIHVNSIVEAKNYAIFNQQAEKLAQFWPGPLTMVLPKFEKNKLASCVTANLDTVAIRIPAHLAARQLINKAATAIAAPSANKSGFLSSTQAEHIYSQFGTKLPILESSTQVTIGLESTIIDLSTEQPTILRSGFFTKDIIEKILNQSVAFATSETKIKSPGMLLRHYAPRTKIRLNAKSLSTKELGLNFADSKLSADYTLNLSTNGNLQEAAANLFDYLYRLDNYALKYGYQMIGVAPIPAISIGIAVNDRLNRASQG